MHYAAIKPAGDTSMRVKRGKLSVGALALAAVFAALLGQGRAEAAPKGWKCSYKIVPIAGPFFRDTGPSYYACFGRDLRETRARARARCRQLPSSSTGACLPLEYTPRSSCERD
mgnify:CR=1 FL=1